MHDAFRYPQGFKLDEESGRIYLPKIGWVRYRKSRRIEGTPKQVTVSLSAGTWFVSIQTERDVPEPVHPSQSAVGIDMGVARFATLSDGSAIKPLNSFRKYEKKLAALQRRMAKRVKFSANWYKLKNRIQRLHRKIANVRNDFLHKSTTAISKNHAVVVIEDLKVRNMSQSVSGTREEQGRHVRAKVGLNKSILDQGWFEFRRQLAYKLAWLGGTLLEHFVFEKRQNARRRHSAARPKASGKTAFFPRSDRPYGLKRVAFQTENALVVPSKFTSQTCSRCGCVDKQNRPTQALFKCTACGFEANADFNAALNILAAGHAAAACGAGRAHAPALKQEPAYGAAL